MPNPWHDWRCSQSSSTTSCFTLVHLFIIDRTVNYQHQWFSTIFQHIKISKKGKIVALLELFPFKRLTKLPLRWCNTVRRNRPSGTRCYLKRKWLSHKINVAVPVLSPVPRHWHPPCFGALHFHSHNFTIQSHIGNQDLKELSTPTHAESHPSPSFTLHPTQKFGNKNSHLWQKVFVVVGVGYVFIYLLY